MILFIICGVIGLALSLLNLYDRVNELRDQLEALENRVRQCGSDPHQGGIR